MVEDLTLLLARARAGESEAVNRLWPLVHAELTRLARSKMKSERPDHTLQASALVNEAYLKLFPGPSPAPHDRNHFMALAAATMRSILVDHARRKGRHKRAAPGMRLDVNDDMPAPLAAGVDIIDLNDALIELAEEDPELVRIIELRFFAGLTVEEVAETLETPKRTIERQLAFARKWLARRLM
jgi:RNA polymerase sigma factor (TIGR02999 family)